MKSGFDTRTLRCTTKLFLTLFIGLILGHTSLSQNERAMVWAFPNQNGMDFSSGSPTPFATVLMGERGTSAICDENGNLLFYSHGQTVWEAGGAIMQGGSGLVGDLNAIQSSIITPSPTSSTRYYLFVVDERTSINLNPSVHYYDVEMTLNGGNGAVIGPTLLLDSATEKLCATRHGNDRDYWVLTHELNSNEFHAFLVDQNGVNLTPVTSAVGYTTTTSLSADHEGQMKISPDGKWLGICHFSSGTVELFRFNNETGVVSDPIVLASSITTFPYGCEFSADSRKFYYSRSTSSGINPVGVHQFDLDHVSEECLLASETIFTNNNPFKLYTDLQLAVDKNIYIGFFDPDPFSVDSLGILEEPWKMCPECEYEDQSFPLNANMSYGLTNVVSSFVSDGITVEFGTNCDQSQTVFFPEDTLDVDSVRWNFGDPIGGANESTQLQATHVFSSPDTFLVSLISYTNGVSDTFQRNVIIWDTAVNLLGNDTTLCNGQPVSFSANWNDACLLWSDSTTNNTYTTTEEGWHWVEVSYQSCQWRDSVFVELVSAPPIVDLGNDTAVCGSIDFVLDPDLSNVYYTWQDGSHDTTFNVTTTGTYWLEASNACGSGSDTLLVEVNSAAQPVLGFPEDTTVCSSSGFAVDVTFNEAVYTWSDGFTGPIRTLETAGTYWVEVGNSCDTVSDTFNLFIDDPIIDALPTEILYCGAGDTIDLLASSDSGMVNWSDGSLHPNLQVTSEGTYHYILNNACGLFTDTVNVLGWDSTFTLRIGNDTTVCDPDFSVEIGNSDERFPWDYTWSTGASSALITATTGSYELSAQNRCVSLTDQININLAFPVGIDRSTLDTVLCQGETKELKLNVEAVQSVEWSTGESTSTISVSEAERYTVDIIDTLGCSHNDAISFNGNCPGLVDAPNVFSPNGDGINDEYCVRLTNVLSFTLHIYNRWGQDVFFSTDEIPCWDGSTNGKPSHSGTYFYVITGLDASGESFEFRGTLTLVN